MSKKLFVRNIDWDTTDQDFQDLFAKIGEVEEAIIIKDRDTGRSKGYGFVTYKNEADAEKAIQELNEQELNGRKIFVDIAKDKPKGPRNN